MRIPYGDHNRSSEPDYVNGLAMIEYVVHNRIDCEIRDSGTIRGSELTFLDIVLAAKKYPKYGDVTWDGWTYYSSPPTPQFHSLALTDSAGIRWAFSGWLFGAKAEIDNTLAYGDMDW